MSSKDIDTLKNTGILIEINPSKERDDELKKLADVQNTTLIILEPVIGNDIFNRTKILEQTIVSRIKYKSDGSRTCRVVF